MDKKTIECSFCSGKGFVPCKTCGGNTTVKCPDCGGEGREYKICKTCYKGYVTDTRSLDEDKTLCPDCHGNYREDLGPCKKCDGKGVLSCESCNGTGKTECPVCKGKGKFSIWDFIEVVYPKDIDEFISICGEQYQGHNVWGLSLDRLKVHDVTPQVWNEFYKYVEDKNVNQNKLDEAFFLGLCLIKGIYHGQNRRKDFEKWAAKEALKRLAEAGHPYGQFIYGAITEGEWNKWLEKAGEGNVSLAPLALVLLAVNNMRFYPQQKTNDELYQKKCKRHGNVAVRLWQSRIMAVNAMTYYTSSQKRMMISLRELTTENR